MLHEIREHPPADVAVDQHLNHEDVHRRDGGRLAHRSITGVNTSQNHRGQRQLPDAFAHGRTEFPCLEGRFGHAFLYGDVDAVSGQQDHQQEPRQEPGHKELPDPDLGHDGIDDERQTRWEEEPQGSGGGQQPQ